MIAFDAYNAPRIIYGEGVSKQVATLLQSLNVKTVMAVYDEGIKQVGIADSVLTPLREAGFVVEEFGGVTADPPVEMIEAAAKYADEKNVDIYIAIGGGGVIDTTKCMAVMHTNPGRLLDYVLGVGKPIPNLCPKVIAIPTTSGTGSEVTSFSVITDKQNGNIKYPLADYRLTPDVAIIDPQFTRSMPKSIVADTGLDVLTHAIEAYVSVMASDYTDGLALHAIEMVFTYLEKSYNGDPLAREKMHNASCIAGMAFTNAFLGLNHSMAHKLGAECHIPHGRANAILLPYVIKYNATKPTKFASFPKYKEYVADERYAKIARRVGLCSADTPISEAVDCLVKAIRELMTVTERPLCIKDCGVSEAEFMSKVDELSYKAFEDQCTTANPVYPLVSEIKELYREAYYGE